MKSLAIVAALALGLVGCATTNPNVLTPNQVYIGAQGADAILVTAKNYMTLPVCPTAAPVCRTPAGVNAIAKAMYVGYGSAAAAGALSATATADYTTATNVYNALIGTGGLCAPNAPAPTSAAVALAQVVTQVKAIQASLKSAAPAS